MCEYVCGVLCSIISVRGGQGGGEQALRAWLGLGNEDTAAGEVLLLQVRYTLHTHTLILTRYLRKA